MRRKRFLQLHGTTPHTPPVIPLLPAVEDYVDDLEEHLLFGHTPLWADVSPNMTPQSGQTTLCPAGQTWSPRLNSA